MRTAFILLPVALALGACGAAGDADAPWLSYTGVDGHAKFLPLTGTAHDPATHPSVTCESCHPGSTFRQPVCTGCHGQSETTALHTSAVTGKVLEEYEWTPPPGGGVAWHRPSCLRCHPQGGVPDVAHQAYFPVGSGTAHDRACGTCHSDPLDKKSLSKLRCVACHGGATVAVPLPGTHATLLRGDSYPAEPTPADCLRCHAGGRVLRIAAHDERRGPSEFGPAGPWDGAHGATGTAVNCFSCHNAPPPLFGGRGPGIASRPWAQDWSIPATTAGQTDAGACRGCHGKK